MSHDGLPKKLSFHGNGGSYPPHGVITATDHGPAVVVTTWIMFSLMGLSVLARFGIRRNFSADNILIFAATVRNSLNTVGACHPFSALQSGRLFENLGIGNIPKCVSSSRSQPWSGET